MMQAIFIAYWLVLLGSFGAVLTCLTLKPQAGTRRLCLAAIWITGAFLYVVAAWLIRQIITASLGELGGVALLIILLACVPIFGAFLALLAIARWRLRPKREFKIIIRRERNEYVARCREMPGAEGRGPDREAAIEKARAAIKEKLNGPPLTEVAPSERQPPQPFN